MTPYIEQSKFGIWNELFFMGFDFFLYILLVFLIETGILKRLVSQLLIKLWPPILPDDSTLDNDVQVEQNLTENEMLGHLSPGNENSPSMLLVHQLVKQYGRKMLAVKKVSFRVGRGECFGLLGVNGAGKTSTFKILTAEEAPSSGDAKLNHYLLSRQRSQVNKQIEF